MKNLIKIGERTFSSKKAALAHYRSILNSYGFSESLNDNDYIDLLALLDYGCEFGIQDNIQAGIDEELVVQNTSESILIVDVRIAKVQFNTKCFEVYFSDNTSCYISYIMMVNRKGYSQESLFIIACRNCIQKDLISLKQKYFKNHSVQGKVKCQETGAPSLWEELAVDHRQPNTLSVIIDRFKEVNRINLDDIEYQSTKNNLIVFKDLTLMDDFVVYHRDKATLRVVRKECNSSRSAMARVKKSPKDLIINSPQLSLF